MGILAEVYDFSWDFYAHPRFYLLLFTHISFIINASLILLSIKSKKLRSSPSTYFIIAIAICDMLLPLQPYLMVFFLEKGDFKVLLFNAAVLFNLQVGFTADRYFVICHPMSYHSHRDSGYQKWIIVTCIAVSTFAFLPSQSSWGIDMIIFLCAFLVIAGILLMLILFILMKTEIAEMVTKMILRFYFSLICFLDFYKAEH
jgi:hypothetical protein